LKLEVIHKNVDFFLVWFEKLEFGATPGWSACLAAVGWSKEGVAFLGV